MLSRSASWGGTSTTAKETLMTGQQLTINILIGIVVNIVTAFLTYWWTTHRDRREHEKEARMANAKIADIAVSHLYTSYMQSKRLKMDVLAHIGEVKAGTLSSEVFGTILDGIARSLEQERVSIVPNIMSWKTFVEEGSVSAQLISKVQEQDFYMPSANEPISPAKDSLQQRNSMARQLPMPPVRQNIQDRRITMPSTPAAPIGQDGMEQLKSFADVLRSPAESAFRAFLSGDAQKLRAVRGNLDNLRGHSEKVAVGSMLALTGDVAGTDLLRETLSEGWAAMDADEFCVAIGGIVASAERNDAEKDAFEFLDPIVGRRVDQGKDPDEKKAFMLNQVQKLLFAVGEHSQAISTLERIVALHGNEPAYWYNLALCYEKKEDLALAERAIRKMLELDSADADHLGLAARVLSKQGYHNEATEISTRLARLDPFKAMLTDAVQEIQKKKREDQSSPRERG